MVPLAGATIAAAEEQLKTPGAHLYRVDCYEPGVGLISTSFTVSTGAPPIKGVPARQLAQELVLTISTPSPEVNTSPGHELYVGVPTFMWVPASSWKPQFDSKSDGVKTVTLRADPYQVKWDMGETVVVCDGPGQPWDPSGPDDQMTDCNYTYEKTSAGQPDLKYKITATVFYKLSFTCTGTCDINVGGLNDKQMWSSTRLGVAERQTVVTG